MAIQVKTVLLIAPLALFQKFIILDPGRYSAATIFTLAAVLLPVGATYWLVRDQDQKRGTRT